MIEAILFDKDGTLIDSERINIESAIRTYADHNFPLPKEAEDMVIGRHPNVYFPEINERYQLDLAHQELRDLQKHHYHSIANESLTLMPGVMQTLTALYNKGIRMAVVSSSTSTTIERQLKEFEIDHFFEVTVGVDEVTSPKPHPEPYLLALSRLGVAAQNALGVEDTATGIESLVRAEVRAVAVPHAYSGAHDFSQASHILRSLAELPVLLDKFELSAQD